MDTVGSSGHCVGSTGHCVGSTGHCVGSTGHCVGSTGHCVGSSGQWCSLRDTQVYAVYPLGKSKDFRIPT